MKIKTGINNELSVTVEIISKLEQEVFEELYKAFPEDDVLILKQISKRREKLRKCLGPFYNKLSKKSKRKVDKKDEDMFE